MISINSRGQVCHGTGGGWASIDNVAFLRGGVGGWILDDSVLFANGDDTFGNDWPASSYDVPTKTAKRLLGETGMNVGYASNQGTWAFWWGTNLLVAALQRRLLTADQAADEIVKATPAQHSAHQKAARAGRGGMYTSTGLHLPLAGLMGVGPDGSIAYKPDYQSGGPTMVRELDGTEWMLTPNHPYGLQLLGQRRAVFADTRTGLTFLNIPTSLVMPGGASGFRAVFVLGQWWFAYYAERLARIVLHPFTELVGYHVSRPGDAWFNLRAFPSTGIAGDTVYVPWSSREGEQPGEMTLDDSVMFNVKSDPRVQLFVPDPAPNPPDPPKPPVIVKPKVTVLKWDPSMKAGVHWHTKFQVNVPATIDVSKNVKDQLVIAAWDENDSDTTAPRQLIVEGPTIDPGPNPPDPPKPGPGLSRCLYSPSIGAIDVPQVFDDMANLADIFTYGMPVQQILTDEPTEQLGPNIWPNLCAKDVVRKLKDAGIALVVEMGSIKPYDCQARNGISDMKKAHQRVLDAGGVISAYTADEPLTANQWPVEQGGCHQSLEACADAFRDWMHAIRDLNPAIKVGWYEAWPEVSFDDQCEFLSLLLDRNALPDYWVPDVDYVRAEGERPLLSPEKFLLDCQMEADKYGVMFGVLVNSTVDPIDPDEAHYDNLIALANRLVAVVPNIALVCVAAWATRDSTLATQNVPNCLGQFGMIHTYHDVVSIFSGTPEPPTPGGDDMKSSTILDLPPIAVKEVRAVPGESGLFSLILVDDPSDPRQPSGATYSMQPTEPHDDFRPNDGSPVADYKPGQYEKCTVDGNLATFNPAGAFFSRMFVRAGGL